MVELARAGLSKNKYSSVNISKLEKHGYLEFRIAGGENYHLKPRLVEEAILRYITALDIASDPNLYREEYLKKLTSLFQRAKDNAEPRGIENIRLSHLLELADDQVSNSLESFLDAAKAGRLSTPAAKKRVTEWTVEVFLRELFESASQLGIKKASPKLRAEMKLTLKRLGVDLSDPAFREYRPGLQTMLKIFGLTEK